MTTLELEYRTNFKAISIKLNGNLVSSLTDQSTMLIELPPDTLLPISVEVEFHPFKIKPIVRYNNFMLDYWLADIELQDHKLSFVIHKTFFEDYKNKNIQGRLDSLGDAQKNIEHYLDKYIGVNNLHPELVDEIKELIA